MSATPERPAFLILWIGVVTAASAAVVHTLSSPAVESARAPAGNNAPDVLTLRDRPGTRPVSHSIEPGKSAAEIYFDLNDVGEVSDADALDRTRARPEGAWDLEVCVRVGGVGVDNARVGMQLVESGAHVAVRTTRTGGEAGFTVLAESGQLRFHAIWDHPKTQMRYVGRTLLDTGAAERPAELFLDLAPKVDGPSQAPPLPESGVFADADGPSVGYRYHDAYVKDSSWAVVYDGFPGASAEDEEDDGRRRSRRVRAQYWISRHPHLRGLLLGHLLLWVDGEPVGEEEADSVLEEVVQNLPPQVTETMAGREARKRVRNNVLDGLSLEEVAKAASLLPPELRPDPSQLEFVLELNPNKVLEVLRNLESIVIDLDA